VANDIEDSLSMSPADLMVVIDGESDDGALVGGFHDDNIAETMDQDERDKLAREILDLVNEDCRARQEWDRLAAKGRKMMGLAIDDIQLEQSITPARSGREMAYEESRGVDWSRKATHPLLGEAVVRFQAQAQPEINPPGGPAKGKVIGDSTEALEDQADRVATYINWLATDECPEWQDQTDRLLFLIPVDGMPYTKVMAGDGDGAIVRRMLVRSHDVWLPWHANSFYEAERVTHRMRWSPQRIRDLQDSGYLIADDLSCLTPGYEEKPDVEKEADKSVGLSDGDTTLDDNRPIEVVEVYKEHDFGDGDGRCPYVFTIARNDEKMLAIRRNWAPNDDDRRRPMHLLTPWPFVLGDHEGPYAYGLPHMIGSLSETATRLLRAILRIAAKHADPAGFIATTVSSAKGFRKTPLEPGELRETSSTIEDIQKGIYFMPSGDAGAFSQILQFIVEAGQRFASTADLQVGAGDTRAPVGTTMAMIEQGSRVYTSIHARLHRAQRRELKMISTLIGAYVDPTETYPFNLSGGPYLIAQDFDDRVDVEPVSDPRISSATQRVAIAQAVHQLAGESPEMYDKRQVHMRMLRALNVADPDSLLLPDNSAVRRDAVSENMCILFNRPVLAVYDQNHDAHLAVHGSWFGGLQPDAQKALLPVFMAHMGEHLAFQYRIKMEQAISAITGSPAGAFLPPPPTPGPRHAGDNADQPAIPPEIERMIDAAAAAAAQTMAPSGGQPGQPRQPSPEEMEAQRKAKETDLKEQRLQLDQGKIMADIHMESARMQADAAFKGQQIDLEKQKLQLDQGKAIGEIAMRQGEMKDKLAEEGRQHDTELAARLAMERAKMAQPQQNGALNGQVE